MTKASEAKTDCVLVTDLSSGPVELHLVVTIERSKNKREKDKVKVSFSERPKMNRKRAAAG
jgi:hypothetical protein